MDNKLYIPQLDKKALKNLSKVDQLISEGSVNYMLKETTYTNGIERHYVDASYPEKGFPYPEAVYGCNIVKRLLKESLNYPLLLLSDKNKLIGSFNEVALKTMKSSLLRYDMQTPITSEMQCFIARFLTNIGVGFQEAQTLSDILSHLIEYDNAYRYRLEDILSESTREAFLRDPRKEIKRLEDIYISREATEDGPNIGLSQKVAKIFKLIRYLLLIPKYKRAFVGSMKFADFKKFQYDEADAYWVCMRSDYLFKGKTFEERQQELKNKGLLKPQGYIIKSLQSNG